MFWIGNFWDFVIYDGIAYALFILLMCLPVAADAREEKKPVSRRTWYFVVIWYSACFSIISSAISCWIPIVGLPGLLWGLLGTSICTILYRCTDDDDDNDDSHKRRRRRRKKKVAPRATGWGIWPGKSVPNPA